MLKGYSGFWRGWGGQDFLRSVTTLTSLGLLTLHPSVQRPLEKTKVSGQVAKRTELCFWYTIKWKILPRSAEKLLRSLPALLSKKEIVVWRRASICFILFSSVRAVMNYCLSTKPIIYSTWNYTSRPLPIFYFSGFLQLFEEDIIFLILMTQRVS